MQQAQYQEVTSVLFVKGRTAVREGLAVYRVLVLKIKPLILRRSDTIWFIVWNNCCDHNDFCL